jgi:transglutaminase-like putative cysteine protease
MRYFKPVFLFRFVCVAVLFSGSLHAQEGIDVVLQKYSNEQAVITNFEDRLEIKNEKGTLVARSYVSTEKLLIGALSPGIYNKEYIFHSYFSTLEDFDASALVPGKKGYVKNDASATKTSRYEDNEILYDDNQQTEISFSGLSPKSLMRTSYTLVHNDLHMLPTAYLQDNLPIARLKYVVTVPKYVQVKFVIKGVLAGKVKQAVEENKNTVTYTFSAEDVPALKRYDYIHSSEWYMLHIIPYVVSYKLPGDDSAQTLGDVSHLYGYLYNFIRDVNTGDDKIIAETAEAITKGDQTQKEKAAHIYQWVQHNIHYIAFEDSLEGYIPRQAAAICTRKFGDCKDMASILVALCRKAGIDAYFTWIGTTSKPYTYEETPIPKVANHMICTVHIGDEWIFMDGTHPLIPFGKAPSAIQGKEALVSINEKEYKIITVPEVDASLNTLTDSTFLTITDKQLAGRAVIHLEGYPSWKLQSQLSYIKNEARDKYIRSFFERGSNKYIQKSYEYSPSDSGNKPCTVSSEFVLADYLQKVGKEYYVNLNLTQYFEDNQIDITDRNVPEYFEFNDIAREVLILEVPAGYHVSYLPSPLSDSVQGVWGFKINYIQDGRRIVMTKEYVTQARVFPVHDFLQHNKMIDELKKQYKETVVLTAD